MKLDYSSGVVTRDRQEAEVFAERDGRLWGRYKSRDAMAQWAPGSWYADTGRYSKNYSDGTDLIAKPKLEKRYARIYAGSIGALWPELAQVTDSAKDAAILCITFRDGKPDLSTNPEWVREPSK